MRDLSDSAVFMDVAEMLNAADPLAGDERPVAGFASTVISGEERRQDPAINPLAQGRWFSRRMDPASTLIHREIRQVAAFHQWDRFLSIEIDRLG
jgi:hypothetical protein